jgi:hypothetical protein
MVVLFWKPIDSHGWIKTTRNEVYVVLEPLGQASRRSAQVSLCEKLTGLNVMIPGGKVLKIKVGVIGESNVQKKYA